MGTDFEKLPALLHELVLKLTQTALMTQIFDLFGLMSNLILYIDERLGDLEVWNQRLGIDSFLIFLTLLYLQCYCLLPSLVVFIKELSGNAGMASGFFPDIPWSITKDFVYFELTYDLTDGTAGVNIYEIGRAHV